jgi:hypothetical protein
MSGKVHAERLARAITLTGLAEPVQANGLADDRINVLCRVPKGSEGGWTELLQKLLVVTESQKKFAHSWQVHICRHYFLKEINGETKMVFGWNISVQSQDLITALEYLIRTIKGEKPSSFEPVEVDEVPMTGVTGMRNMPRKPGGKGVHTIGGSEGDFAPGKR